MGICVRLPHSPAGGEETIGYARLVSDGLGARLWLGQTTHAEPHQVLAYLAGAGLRVPSGTAVTLTPLRHPYEAALQARGVALLSGRPHVERQDDRCLDDLRQRLDELSRLFVQVCHRKV